MYEFTADVQVNANLDIVWAIFHSQLRNTRVQNFP
jgi:hypothetical protein